MSSNPALKHHFQLSLSGAWVWWIRVIVLYITLGGLLEDNPLLGETRPNTTSLISLLRPCCFVATESHAQLSDTAWSPYWWRIPPIFRGHLRCPLTDFMKSSSLSLCLPILSLFQSGLRPRPCVPRKSSVLLWPEDKADHDEPFWQFLSPLSRSTPCGSSRECRWIWMLKQWLWGLLQFWNRNNINQLSNLCKSLQSHN